MFVGFLRMRSAIGILYPFMVFTVLLLLTKSLLRQSGRTTRSVWQSCISKEVSNAYRFSSQLHGEVGKA